MDETLSLLVHANSKTGKTTLGSTCPPPLLVLDADTGGSKFITARKVKWDPMREAPPVCDGTWEMCVVNVRDWATVLQVFAWLDSGQHCFRSVLVDSITEIQRKCKQNLVGTEQMRMQDWGSLLVQMDAVIRGYRDLTQHVTNPVQVVMFIAETRQSKTGKYVPTMQGQISDSLPYWVDICGYLFTQPTLDANGQPAGALMRRLLITPNDQYEAGERVQGRLGSVVDNPNVSTMLLAVYPHLQALTTNQ